MRPQEIVAKISWAPDIDPAVRQAVDGAILRLGGGNRPVFDEMTVHVRLEKFIKGHGTAKRAAEALGISKAFLSDLRYRNRPIPDGVLRALSIEKIKTRDQFRDL